MAEPLLASLSGRTGNDGAKAVVLEKIEALMTSEKTGRTGGETETTAKKGGGAAICGQNGSPTMVRSSLEAPEAASRAPETYPKR